MVLNLLSSLATFSLKKPKTVLLVIIGAAVLMFGLHYKLLVGERDKLRVAEAGYQLAIEAFNEREAVMREDARIAAAAVVTLTAERNSNISALSALKRGRQIDVEARTWGEQGLPIGEISRLCETLPEMVGCQNTLSTR